MSNNKITGDEPINGWPSTLDDNGNGWGNGNDGLTIRQHYAGLAMQGILANSEFMRNHQNIDIHKLSVKNADELIKQLNSEDW